MTAVMLLHRRNYSPGKRDDDVRDTFAAAHMGLHAHTGGRAVARGKKNENNLAY